MGAGRRKQQADHLGRALKDFVSRGEVVIATKMHEGPNGAGLSRKAILYVSSPLL